jgi:hypothetical protein
MWEALRLRFRYPRVVHNLEKIETLGRTTVHNDFGSLGRRESAPLSLLNLNKLELKRKKISARLFVEGKGETWKSHLNRRGNRPE